MQLPIDKLRKRKKYMASVRVLRSLLNDVTGAVPREKRKVLKDKNEKKQPSDQMLTTPYFLGIPQAPDYGVFAARSSRSEGRPCLVDGPRSPEPKPRESGFHATQDRGVPKHRSRPVCLHPHATLQCRMFLGSSRGGDNSLLGG